MKNAFRKSIFRSIKESFPRFISIILIVFLGAGILAGLVATSPNMQDAGDAYYDKSNIMDVRLLSTVGFDQSDIDAIKEVKGVNGVLPSYTLDAVGEVQSSSSVFRIESLPTNHDEKSKDYINHLELTKGSWPKNNNEVIFVAPSGADTGVKIGDSIKLNKESTDITSSLKESEYIISGFANTPMYLSFMQLSTNIGRGKIDYAIYLPEDNFKLPVYTNVYVTIDDAKDLDTFSNAYTSHIEKVETKLESLAKTQSALKYTQFSNEIDQQLEMVPSPAKEQMKEEELSKLSKPEWHVLNRNKSENFVSFKDDTLRMKSLASVFPIIFYLVAALVSLTTMTRMVDEDRILIGTFKALGYPSRRIVFRYIGYAASASVIGSVLGVLVGFQLLPSVIWNAYGILYTFPPLSPNFSWPIALLTVIVSILCTTAVTAIVLKRALNEVPASLMLPKTAPKGKRIFLEHIKPIWSRLSFSKKVTIRNMFLNKSRMLMTIIGIVGCTSLLLTGFGIRGAINTLVSDQFKDIQKYDTTVGFTNENNSDLANVMSNDTYFKESALVEKNSMEASINKNDSESVFLITPEKNEDLKPLLQLNNRISKKDINLNDNSVIISEKLSMLLDVGVGDTIDLNYLGALDKHKVTITDVCENYVFNYAYIGQDAYQKAFDKTPSYNTYLSLTQDNIDESKVKTALDKVDGIDTIQFTEDFTSSIYSSLDSINIIILVLIVASGLLAFVVLYNLTNINIGERQREIATIKVLGFYDKETYEYILRESFGLSIIGCIIGLVVGIFLYVKVVETVEMDYLMFARTIPLFGYISAAILTILFSVLVSFVMTFKIKKIDMLESLKSVE